MKQQINLLNPALLKKTVLINMMNIALCAAVLLGLMLSYYAYAYQQSVQLNTQRNQAQIALVAMQDKLKTITRLHQPKVLNQALLDEIMRFERQEVMQQKVLHVVSESSATAENSYAAIMLAFAKQSLEGLWLTGFSIESHNEAISISGRSLQPELVPEYIARLGDEPALKGQSFAALSMNLATEAAASNSNLTPVGLMPAAANSPATAAPPQQKAYIEFILKSNDDKSPANMATGKNLNKPGAQP